MLGRPRRRFDRRSFDLARGHPIVVAFLLVRRRVVGQRRACDKLQSPSYELHAARYELRAMSCEPRATSYEQDEESKRSLDFFIAALLALDRFVFR